MKKPCPVSLPGGDGKECTCSPREVLLHRIKDYLCAGGLVNPEMMEHDKVRDLLLDVREYLRDKRTEKDR